MSLIAKRLVLAALASLVLTTRAADKPSDEQPPEEIPYEERVEVRAPVPDEEDVAAFATRVDARDAGGRGEDLADLLRRVPGARVRDYGGLGSYATVSLRGSTSEQVTVLVDGVPQNRALGGPVDLSSIPTTQLDHITVYRGFAPAGYGLGGIGGVVDVRTRGQASDLDGQADLLVGELSTARLSGSTSLATGATGRLRLGAEAMRSDGDFVYLDTGATFFDPDDDVERQRENNELKQVYGLIQQMWDFGNEDQINISLRLQDRRRGLAGLDGLPSRTARLDESLQDLTASWSNRGSGTFEGFDLQLNGFNQEVVFADPDGDVGLGAQDQTTRLAGAGAVGMFRFDLGRQQLTTRLELRHERARVSDRALALEDRGGADRNQLSVTVEDVVRSGRFSVAPSVRWEQATDRFHSGSAGTLPPPADDTGQAGWSGKIGVARAVGQRTSVRGSVGHFYRNPSLLELFGDRGAVVGNPRLKPESGNSAELGIVHGWQRPAVDVELVGFGRRAENLIRLVPASQGVAVPRNLGQVEIVGAEASVNWNGGGGFSLQAGATLQRATDVTSQERPVPYQPEQLGFLGVAWQNSRFRVLWDVTYVGRNSTDTLDTPELRMPERVVHDLQLAHRWRNGLVLGLDVRNLLDRQHRDLLRYPLPDRVVLVHVGWSSGGSGP
jgi:iron complex outermembrane receptor protein